jgi:hypothetical protein
VPHKLRAWETLSEHLPIGGPAEAAFTNHPGLRASMADLDDPSSSASMPADASPSPGVKRKRAADPKFYAVRAGHRPGIYHSWSECLAQVKGFKGATCKLGALDPLRPG